MISRGVNIWPTGCAIVLGGLVAPKGAFGSVRIGDSIVVGATNATLEATNMRSTRMHVLSARKNKRNQGGEGQKQKPSRPDAVWRRR